MYRLIIIDDEDKIAEGIAELFPWQNIGFDVVKTFNCAVQALHFIENHAIDVVLTDIQMPDMTGIELIEKLQIYPELKIVMFSSYQNYEYMRAGINYGVCDYLLKPVRYAELVSCFEKIRGILDQSKHTKTLPPEPPKTYYGEIIERVDRYLNENYQDASLDRAAEIVGLSSNYLSKIFKEKSGLGFLEKLNKIRMEKACELLADPTFKQYEIAFYVGYDNPKNFSRAFKSYYGVSPMEYKNGTRKGE